MARTAKQLAEAKARQAANTAKKAPTVKALPVAKIPPTAKVIDSSTYMAIPKAYRPTNVIVTPPNPAQSAQKAADFTAATAPYLKDARNASIMASNKVKENAKYDAMDLGFGGVIRKLANIGPSTKDVIKGTPNFLKNLVGNAGDSINSYASKLKSNPVKTISNTRTVLGDFLTGSSPEIRKQRDAAYNNIKFLVDSGKITPEEGSKRLVAESGIGSDQANIMLNFVGGGTNIFKQIAKSTDKRFIESALKGTVDSKVLPSLTKELTKLTKTSEVKAAIDAAKNGTFVPKAILERRATRMHPEDVKLMERVINDSRLKGEITPSVRTESTFLAQHLGINPEQTDRKLANAFEKFIEKNPALKSRITGIPVKKNTLPGFVKNPFSKEDPLLQEAKKYSTPEEFVNKHLNESPIQDSEIQRTIKDLNNAGIKVSSPDDIVTLYHGTNAKGMSGITNSKSLNPFSYLATDKEASKGFAFGSKGGVLEIKVPVSDLGYVQQPMAGKSGATIQTPFKLVKGSDGIYRADRSSFNTSSQLTDLWKQAHKRKTIKGFIKVPGVKEKKIPLHGPVAPEKDIETINRQLGHIVKGKRLQQAKNNALNPETQRRRAIFEAGVKASREKQQKIFTSQITASRKLQDNMSKVAARDAMKEWRTESVVARENAHAEAVNFATKLKQDGLDIIAKHQAGKKYEERVVVEKMFADLKSKAEKAGFEFGTREHYLPQVYKNSTEEVKKAMANFMKDRGVDEQIISDYVNGIAQLGEETARKLGLNPSFTKEATFPSYEVAMRYGLKPKYEKISQLVGYYNERLNTAIANKHLIENLVKNKEISVIKGDGMVPVNLPGAETAWFANPKTAKFINDIFRDENALNGVEKFFKYGSKVSRMLQEIVLSGGIPKTNVNFFTLGHVIKSITSGIGNVALLDFRGAGANFKAIANVVRSNFTKSSIKWFAKKEPIITMMAQEGIDLTSRVGGYKEFNRGWGAYFKKSDVKELIGDGFDRLFNEKTFNSFLPMQQVSMFEGSYKTALKKGLTEKEASKLAGEVTKKFMGISDSLRGVTAQEAINTTFFAPKFREGLINTYWNTIKSLNPKTWKDMSYHQNRALIAGMAITFLGYDLANKKMNGHHLWENPVGHKLELMYEKDGRVFYFPFMPSQLAFFRANIEGGAAAFTGDFSTAGQKFGSNLSMGIHLLTDIMSNKDYFGNEIYDKSAPGSTKLKQIASYVGLSYNHPFVKGAYQIIQNKIAQLSPVYPEYKKITELKNKGMDKEADDLLTLLTHEQRKEYYDLKDMKLLPLDQIASQMMELPVKFSSVGRIKTAERYQKIDDMEKEIKKIPAGDLRTEKLQELLTAIPDQEERSSVAYILSQRGVSTAGISLSDTMIRMKPTYEKVQSLIDEGKTDEAATITRGMSKSEYEDYKKVRAVERGKHTARTRELLAIDPKKAVEYVRSFRKDEAERIAKNLTKEEYAIYKTGIPR